MIYYHSSVVTEYTATVKSPRYESGLSQNDAGVTEDTSGVLAVIAGVMRVSVDIGPGQQVRGHPSYTLTKYTQHR